MTRRVFFSFHYDRDIWRANVVRNSWVTHEDREAAGFWDGSLWEEAKRQGDEAIKRLINRGLENTSVTAVLIGAETAGRTYVRYEIEQSVQRGNGLLGVYINRIADRNGYTDYQGRNPLDEMQVRQNGWPTPLSRLYPTYEWKTDNGYQNLGNWVEEVGP